MLQSNKTKLWPWCCSAKLIIYLPFLSFGRWLEENLFKHTFSFINLRTAACLRHELKMVKCSEVLPHFLSWDINASASSQHEMQAAALN